jgi:SAM-dependent methyltransferase
MRERSMASQDSCPAEKKAINAQRRHWDETYVQKPELFGREPSYPARRALEIFRKEGKRRILELGAGQGRDTFFFAQNGLAVHALDYSKTGVEMINAKAGELGLSDSVVAACHDARQRLPFEDDSFDACYSHMLCCMALSSVQLEFLFSEMRRVLRPAGLNVYTVRNTTDPEYKKGTHRGEDMYDVTGGFIVHFYSEEKVMRLAQGYEILRIERFEESQIPKRLFLVTLRKTT